MTQHYFTKTGEYGLSEDLPDDVRDWMVVPTGHWTIEMFELMESTTPVERFDLAKHFNVNVHRIFAGECKVCKLSTAELDGQWLVTKENTSWLLPSD
jgi:hypothetical protein